MALPQASPSRALGDGPPRAHPYLESAAVAAGVVGARASWVWQVFKCAQMLVRLPTRSRNAQHRRTASTRGAKNDREREA